MKNLLLAISLLFATSIFSQGIFVEGSLQSGWLMKNMNTNGGKVKSQISLPATAGIGLHVRLADVVGISAGFSQSYIYWRLKDQDFISRNDFYSVKMNLSSFYYSYYGSFHVSLPIERYFTYMYFQGTFNYNTIGAYTLNEHRIFPVNNEDIFMNAKYTQNNYSIVPEIGIQKFINSGLMFTAGVNYSIVQGENMITGDYSVEKNGEKITESSFSTQGSVIGINVSLKYKIANLGKIRLPKKTQMRPIDEEEIIVVETPKDTVKDPVTNPDPPKQAFDTSKKEMGGRPYDIAQKITFEHPIIKIMVWDDKRVDGDIISIYLNDNTLLSEYSLTKEQKEVKGKLLRGANDLILFAHNLGDIPPNTAVFYITDGFKTEKVVLKSTLKNSTAVRIYYDPK